MHIALWIFGQQVDLVRNRTIWCRKKTLPIEVKVEKKANDCERSSACFAIATFVFYVFSFSHEKCVRVFRSPSFRQVIEGKRTNPYLHLHRRSGNESMYLEVKVISLPLTHMSQSPKCFLRPAHKKVVFADRIPGSSEFRSREVSTKRRHSSHQLTYQFIGPVVNR